MTSTDPNLRQLFLLDPAVIYLNHGSFGATPQPVMAEYQAWQLRLERQPVAFLGREIIALLAQARRPLADYLGVADDTLIFVPNATFGVNVVARSLTLGPGDEVLATDHEYGACDRVWQFLSQKRGFRYVRQPIPLPLAPPEVLVEQLWAGVTPRTRLIFASHISSTTAVTFPIAEIGRRARQAGILTLFDGAHTPGMIPLNLDALEVDFYTGNCHKWLCSPKGAGFLYTRPERQSLIEPLVISWGWGAERTVSAGSDYLDHGQWWGTRDPAPYLAVPAAIRFQADHDWPAVRARCHRLLAGALAQLAALTGQPSPYRGPGDYHQMAIAPLPPIRDRLALMAALYEGYRIEVPCTEWNGRHFIRISVQGYNSQADLNALAAALADLLPAHARGG